jgi:RecA-family ATPase
MIEISVAVAESIASWRRIFVGRNGADARELLRMAAADFWETLEINQTVHPESHMVARQEVVDALHDMAQIGSIGPDDAQHIFAESFNGEGRADGHGEKHESQHDELPFIDMSTWDSPAPPRQWAVKDRIPLRQPTLFSGEGAIGKTLIALQLSVAHVTARDWLGTSPEPGPAIYLGAEDEADELHRRLADIAAHYGVRFADLAGGFHLLSFAGKDAILGTIGRDGIIKPTALFEQLHRAAKKIQPKLITLDTVSDIFIGNENDRAQVRQFVALLRGLAIDANAGVLVLSHPSLTGINTGTGLSGSTGWHNSVRGRIYLSPATTEAGEEPDKDLRQLEFMKNNYGPLAERILLRWKNGVYVPEPGFGSLEKAAADAKAENLFLDLLARFNTQGRNVNDKTGPTYAPTLFAHESEAKGARIGKQAFANAMRRLFANNRIHLEPYGKPSRQFNRLVPGAAP